ncbi:MAG: MFS transporter [Rhizobiaceae bacterium]
MTATPMPQAKRAAFILAAAQAIVGSVPPIAISMGALAGVYLLGADKSLATAPVSGFNIGVAVGALPAAWLARKIGQKHAFMTGALVTSLGGAIAALALFQGSFWLFVAALLLLGTGGSFAQQYRFAAADNSPSSFKPQAISWVLGGGIVSAVLGAQAVIFTKDVFLPVQFAGAYMVIILFGFVGFAILTQLKLQIEPPKVEGIARDSGRPLGQIIAQPRFMVALLCSVGSYALMSLVMTGAPLAMVGCGFSVNEATLGIQWHVLAMFGPSFFTGSLIARYGRERVVATGLIILIGCAFVALSGIQLWNFWLSLVLLGLGWNFGFIGATAMVTDCYRPEEKSKVQGFHDTVLFGSVASASLLSGKIFLVWGWGALNWMILPVTGLCLIALVWLSLTKRSVVA